MWERRTFHECAMELNAVSQEFRAAHRGDSGWGSSERDRIMHETSKNGVALLKILAASIRSDQDYGLAAREI
jgi:hypothetical protein